MKVHELIDNLKGQDQNALIEVRSVCGDLELLQETGIVYMKNRKPEGHSLLVLEMVT